VARHGKVFDFEIFLDAVARTLAAEARLLDAAEGSATSFEIMPELMPTMP
jgi:hypothetical protein